ncbi:hypothetical protein [Roseateles sp. LKC17W]|uniref:Uncharacterized protein n=1 Tax=Pelomonas margarita TaxID=3299031 RepID=A0ABW7FGV3_9BURK
MTGKHYNWHRAWRRDDSGHLLHQTGLRVLVRLGDAGSAALVTEGDSLRAFADSEQARGVPSHHLKERLQRLLREASQWHQRNP